MTEQQYSEQPQDISKAVDESGFNVQVFNNVQSVTGNGGAATQLGTEDPPANQCHSNFNSADRTSSLIHFGVDTATLGACHATDKAASSAPEISNTEQASTGACTTQACNTTSQAAPLALSSTAAAAQEAGFSRAGAFSRLAQQAQAPS
ncbi:hypothetical protein ABBQ32_001958 [Trebouxia sp. C0010 RCD-2024]